jgi:AraC-like DNA-binding protein
MCHLEFEPLSGAPLDAEATLLAMPGLSVGRCLSAIPARWSRTAELVKDGDDSFALIMPIAETVTRSMRGQEFDVKPGEAAGILHSEPASIQFHEFNSMCLMVPRSSLGPLVPDLEEAATRLVTRANDALRLLRLYLTAWRETFDITDPAVCRLAATHVHDLIALALGATRDAAAVANGRGLRAARLKAVKADIAANLTARDLSVAAVALRQRVTPRYIHMLFDGEGTTFSQHVLAERLAHAHRLLLDPGHAHQSISAIAYASGFGDLSHFNHAFRRSYGATPSEVRRGAAE